MPGTMRPHAWNRWRDQPQKSRARSKRSSSAYCVRGSLPFPVAVVLHALAVVFEARQKEAQGRDDAEQCQAQVGNAVAERDHRKESHWNRREKERCRLEIGR